MTPQPLGMVLLVFLMALSGCAAHRGDTGTPATVSDATARAVTIFRGDGSRAAWNDLVNAAAGSDAILFGENHGHPLGLAAASALWKDVLTQSPNAALAMEFFERDEQSRLDEYLSGVTDETAFRKRCARSDSNYPPGHRAMVEAAKAAHRPVIAANAPRPYVRVARTSGYDRLGALGPSQRALFRIPDELPTRDTRYRKAFDDVMEGDADKPTEPGPKAAAGPTAAEDPLERSQRHDDGFRAQSLWDWTMAESVANAISGGNRPVLLVVGRFHVDHQGGLVQALSRLQSGCRILTVSFVDRHPPAFGASSTGLGDDLGRADFVVYVGPSR